MTGQPMPYTTPGRTVIPCYCWIAKPGTGPRCMLQPGHDGPHYNRIKRVEWPNRGPEPQ